MFLLGILTKIAITSEAGFVDLSGFNLSLTSCALSSSFLLGSANHVFQKKALNSMDILEQNQVILVMVNLKYSLSRLLKEHCILEYC